MRAMNPRNVRALLVLLVVLIGFGVAARSDAVPDKHAFGLDDYSALRRASARAVSPDGKTVLYEVSYDGDKGPTKHEWRLIDTSGANSRKLELPESFEPAGFTRDGGLVVRHVRGR